MDDQSKSQNKGNPKEQKQSKQKRGRSRSPSRARLPASSVNPDSPITRSQAARLKDVKAVERESTVAIIDHALNNSVKNTTDEHKYNPSLNNNNTSSSLLRSDETLISDHMRQTSINDVTLKPSLKQHHRTSSDKVLSKHKFSRSSRDTPRNLYGLDHDSDNDATVYTRHHMGRTKVKREPSEETEHDEANPLQGSNFISRLMVHDSRKLHNAATIIGVILVGMVLSWCLFGTSGSSQVVVFEYLRIFLTMVIRNDMAVRENNYERIFIFI